MLRCRLRIIRVELTVKNIHLEYTVVPVINGHHRDQAKLSVHGRWLLVVGIWIGGVKRITPCTNTFITTSDIHTEHNVMRIVIIMFSIVIEPKANAS